jgi:hypothetical protein
MHKYIYNTLTVQICYEKASSAHQLRVEALKLQTGHTVNFKEMYLERQS